MVVFTAHFLQASPTCGPNFICYNLLFFFILLSMAQVHVTYKKKKEKERGFGEYDSVSFVSFS